MKIEHVLGLAALAYFAVVGINEFLPLGTVSSLDSLPDWGSITGSTGSSTAGAGYLAGGLDLATAGAIYWFVLHKKL